MLGKVSVIAIRASAQPKVVYEAAVVKASHAKQADERLELEDLRRATQVIARTLLDLLQ